MHLLQQDGSKVVCLLSSDEDEPKSNAPKKQAVDAPPTARKDAPAERQSQGSRASHIGCNSLSFDSVGSVDEIPEDVDFLRKLTTSQRTSKDAVAPTCLLSATIVLIPINRPSKPLSNTNKEGSAYPSIHPSIDRVYEKVDS